MRRVLGFALAFVLMGGAALASETHSLAWTGSWSKQVVVEFTTLRSGAIDVSTTFQIKNNTAIALSVRNEDYSAQCYAQADYRRSGSSGTGVLGCSIPSAPVGLYRIVVNPALGGSNHGVLTFTAETEP